MNTTTQTDQLHTNLTLLDPSGTPITIQDVALKLIQKEGIPSECHLSFQVTPDLYQCIDTNAIFHLKPELRSPVSNGKFQSEFNIEITATLQPQLLPSLTEQATNSEAAINYLSQLSQTPSNRGLESDLSPPEINVTDKRNNHPAFSSPLLQTESWFALHVKQQQASGEIGYRTFWSYVSPTILTQEITSRGQVSTAMGHFFQDLTTADGAIAEAAISEILEDLFQGLDAWVDNTLLPSAEGAISNIVDELSHAFETWLDSSQSSDAPDIAIKKPIYQAMLTFFSEDDWSFAKLQGETTLHLAFQGEHGQWNCYALARDEQAQFLFYSVYPATVPENQRLAISEFMTRANYGLLSGNFELDFDSGEIRYKTSLDVTHLSISPLAIQQLVYTNVTMMDHYLPGILAVLEQGMQPHDAIQMVEKSELSE